MKKLLMRISFGSFSNLLLPISSILTVPFLTRLLGPQGKGELTLILQPMTIIDAFAGVGISSYMLANFKNKEDARHSIKDFMSVIIFAQVISVLLLICWFKFVISNEIASNYLIVFCYLLLPIGTLLTILRTRKIIEGKLSPIVFESILNVILRVCGIYYLIYSQINDPSLLSFFYITSGISSGIIFLRPNFRDIKSSIHRKCIFLIPSGALWIFEILYVVSVKIDQIAISFAVSSANLGLYSVAVLVAELPLLIGNSITRELVNTIKNKNKPTKEFVLVTELFFVSSCLIAYLLTFQISRFFGEGFLAAQGISQILVIVTYLRLHVEFISRLLLTNRIILERFVLYVIPVICIILGSLWILFQHESLYYFLTYLIFGWSSSLIFGFFILFRKGFIYKNVFEF